MYFWEQSMNGSCLKTVRVKKNAQEKLVLLTKGEFYNLTL